MDDWGVGGGVVYFRTTVISVPIFCPLEFLWLPPILVRRGSARFSPEHKRPLPFPSSSPSSFSSPLIFLLFFHHVGSSGFPVFGVSGAPSFFLAFTFGPLLFTRGLSYFVLFGSHVALAFVFYYHDGYRLTLSVNTEETLDKTLRLQQLRLHISIASSSYRQYLRVYNNSLSFLPLVLPDPLQLAVRYIEYMADRRQGGIGGWEVCLVTTL